MQSDQKDWQSQYPEILRSWNYAKNDPRRPEDITHGTRAKIWWICEKGHEWETPLPNRILGYGCTYCSNKTVLVGFNDLSTTHPNLVREWHPKKNGPLLPEQFVAGSKKSIWWLCEKGHEWQSAIAHRAKNNSRCLICTYRLVVEGVNDLGTTNPELAKEWDSDKNSPLTPQQVTRGSGKKYWWRCPKGHESFMSPFERTRRREVSPCQKCANNVIAPGENDLATVSPLVAKQWDFSKNAPDLPNGIIAGSAKSFWWICEMGHEWKASVFSRVKQGTGCPVCLKRYFVEGANDLQITHPEISKEWDYEKNFPQKPSDITSGNNKKAWWLCPLSHSYNATPASRAVRKTGCPYCAGRKVLLGFNDLETTHPLLARQLVAKLNGGVTGKDISAGSQLDLFWKCEKGHVTKKQVKTRVKTLECSVCSNYEVLEGFNDLATVNPKVLEEWDSEKNVGLEVSKISAFTEKKAWWLCPLGHSYRQLVRNKAIVGSGCPICSGKEVLTGFNDLASKRPDLLDLWDFRKNAELEPTAVTVSSGTRAWWKCEKGHSWQSNIANISSGSRCPSCAPGGFDQTKPALVYFIQNKKVGARKVGITNQGIRTDRLLAFAEHGWQEVAVVNIKDGVIARKVETAVLRWIRRDCGLPPYLGKQEMGRMAGWRETFSSDGPTNAEVIKKINALVDQLNRFASA